MQDFAVPEAAKPGFFTASAPSRAGYLTRLPLEREELPC